MLARIKGTEFKALGISFAAYPGDVELDIGPLGVTLMWGDALLPGMFIRLGGRERHLAWPWKVGGKLTSGRELLPGYDTRETLTAILEHTPATQRASGGTPPRCHVGSPIPAACLVALPSELSMVAPGRSSRV